MLKSKEFLSKGFVKRLTDEVTIIQIDNTKYILKKIVLPIDAENEKNKCTYLDYLISNGIRVAKVIDYWSESNVYYELQEYVSTSDKSIHLKVNIFEELARLHKVSSNYMGKEYNDKVYKVNFECYGNVFEQLLIGFYEKYYLYSRKSYDAFNIKSVRSQRLFDKYEQIFFKLYNSSNVPQFICHNDMTSNNILNTNEGICFIDFDLGTKTMPYVDVADAILTRTYNLGNIVADFEAFKKNVYHLVNKYNSIYDILSFDEVIDMIKIKVISFFFYIHYNKQNFNIFKYNLDEMLKLVDK